MDKIKVAICSRCRFSFKDEFCSDRCTAPELNQPNYVSGYYYHSKPTNKNGDCPHFKPIPWLWKKFPSLWKYPQVSNYETSEQREARRAAK